ncbi:DUF4163 domain-containing protein [Sphingomonas sp. Mn802worker]|uniref:DUF4163 domain-containing protein n=1 Tax=Sphingomonas sp. Mn802worker TaxID=629773 RepID=UPI0003A22C6C|nr:DUF4163 domain-containing protein [Sphingomonas sp. Mn802worker]
MTAAAMVMATSVAKAESVKTGDYSFIYSYPAEAAAIPQLRARLNAEDKALKGKTARDAAAARRESKNGSFPFRAYETQKTWKVVTSTPRFLSLSSDAYEYTGGAHGNPSSGALVWDKARGVGIDPTQVFTSTAALQRVIAPTYCARLKAERSRRLAPYKDTSDTFSQCPTLKELTLLLGSSNRQRIDRIGLIADPYVAGSYAEGAYEVTLPVTPAILSAVRPAYRAAFAAR